MDANPMVFHSGTVLRFPNVASFGRKSIFALKEIADVHSLLNSSNGIKLSVSSVRSDGDAGDRPPIRSSARGRIRKNESSRKTKSDGNKALEDQNPKSKNQEEIIALFKRIQTSIAKEDSAKTKGEDSQKDKVGARSILVTLGESKKKEKGQSSKKSEDKGLRTKNVPQEQEMHLTLPAADFKPIRPPSKFVKRSPIPPPKDEASQAIAESKELHFHSIEDMKLTELKALAKSRGIRGYSKLKKNELLELLRS